MEYHSSGGTNADVAEEKETREHGMIADHSVEEEEEKTEEWEGYEVERVADEDAAEYEEEQPGIKFKYSLTQEDIYSCLKNMKIFRTSGVRAAIETVLVAACAVPSVVQLFSAENLRSFNISNFLFPVICLLLIVAIWLVPYFTLKKRAKEQADGKMITVEVYPDEINIGEGEGKWEIPLDGTSYYEEVDDMMVITTPQKQTAAFPFRAIEPSALPEIQAIIISGTIPKPRKGRKRGR